MNEHYYSILSESRLFAGLPAEAIMDILPCLDSRIRRYRRGQTIIAAGAPVIELGLMLQGKAQISRIDYWGSRDIIASLEPGEIFAESYALAGVPCGAEVRADAASAVLFLSITKLLQPCGKACPAHGELISHLAALLADKNLQMSEKLGQLAKRRTRGKLLSYLDSQARLNRSSAFTIPFDRQELADYLSVDRSALSRQLSKLRKEGILDYRKNHFLLRQAIDRETQN